MRSNNYENNMSNEQKQLIREKWEKQYPDCTTGGVKCIDCSDKKDIENFWLNEIDLAIKQTEERIVEKIEKEEPQNQITQAILGGMEYRGFDDCGKYLDEDIWERLKPLFITLIRNK